MAREKESNRGRRRRDGDTTQGVEVTPTRREQKAKEETKLFNKFPPPRRGTKDGMKNGSTHPSSQEEKIISRAPAQRGRRRRLAAQDQDMKP